MTTQMIYLMQPFARLALGCLLLSCLAATAQEQPRPGPITVLKDSSPVMYGRSAKVKAVVEAIDLDSREITVRSGKGRVLTMRVEERVRNLPEIAVGDEVTLRYNESVGLEIRRAQDDETIAVGNGDTSDEEQPQGQPARTTTIADVDAVNPGGKTLTIRDPDGRLHDLYVRNVSLLDALQPGDRVVVTYTAASVVAVEGPKKDPAEKPAKKKRRKQ